MADQRKPLFERTPGPGRTKTPARPDYRAGQAPAQPARRTAARPDYSRGAAHGSPVRQDMPERPVYPERPEARRTRPGRPVYDYDREAAAARHGPSGRVDDSAGSLGPDGLPRRTQRPAAPFVNTLPGRAGSGQGMPPRPGAAAQRRAEEVPGRSRRLAERAPDRSAARPPAWHASPEQEVPLKPRAAAYDQAKDALPGRKAPHQGHVGGQAGKKPGFFARRAAARRRKKAWQAAHPPTPAQLRARKIRRGIFAGLAAAVIVAAGCAVSAAMLFKIQTITVVQPEEGTAYSNEQILEAFGTPTGANIFSFRADTAAQTIAAALPYLETVSISRQLPDTVLITVTAAAETYCVPADTGGVAVVSAGMKVLRTAPAEDESAAALIQVTGAQAAAPVAGQPLAFTEPDKLTVLQQILAQTQSVGLVPIGQIDLTDILELSFVYDGRIKILLGTANDLAYKVEWAWRLVTPQEETSLPDTAQGTLDVSRRNSEGRGQASWREGVF